MSRDETAPNTPEEPPGLPRVVRTLWGWESTGARGPRPGLSLEQIATAAVSLADAGGLSAVSMAAVGKALGRSAMSLYRYVDSKEDLHLAMVDVAMGDPPELDPALPWRQAATAFARAEVAMLLAHPWLLELDQPTYGPNGMAWMESGLGALDGLGLDPQETASSLLTLDGYVRNNARLTVRFGGIEHWSRLLERIQDDPAFARIGNATRNGVFATEGSDFPRDEFGFGLGIILDGIAARAPR